MDVSSHPAGSWLSDLKHAKKLFISSVRASSALPAWLPVSVVPNMWWSLPQCSRIALIYQLLQLLCIPVFCLFNHSPVWINTTFVSMYSVTSPMLYATVQVLRVLQTVVSTHSHQFRNFLLVALGKYHQCSYELVSVSAQVVLENVLIGWIQLSTQSSIWLACQLCCFMDHWILLYQTLFTFWLEKGSTVLILLY